LGEVNLSKGEEEGEHNNNKQCTFKFKIVKNKKKGKIKIIRRRGIIIINITIIIRRIRAE